MLIMTTPRHPPSPQRPGLMFRGSLLLLLVLQYLAIFAVLSGDAEAATLESINSKCSIFELHV